MRINQNFRPLSSLRIFYDRFRELYGNIFSNSMINNLLENYEFITVCFVPKLNIYHEIDLPSQDIAKYYIALNEDNMLKPRFIIRWHSVPLTTGDVANIIGEIEIVPNIGANELFCESHNILIYSHSPENQIDSEFMEQIFATTKVNEKADIMRQHLQKIIDDNDPRFEMAEYLLERYPEKKK